MRKNNPKISVIIRTYNMAEFLKEAIESALNQTIDKRTYEILVIDDGSIDDTKTVLKEFRGEIRLIKQKHSGNIAALNKGIALSRGAYIIILDADDLFLPGILKEMFSVFGKNKRTDFVYCDYYEKNMETGKEKSVSLKENIFKSVAGGIMFKKKMLIALGMYNPELIFPEYEILIKAQGKYTGRHLSKALFIYRRHGKSITANKKKVLLGKKQLFRKYKQIRGLKL